MYGAVPTVPRKLDDYRPIVGDEAIEAARRLAAPLRGARVLHLSITTSGTGVAETLSGLVPLLNDAGLSAEWQVIRGAEEFLSVNRAIYRALGGLHEDWTPEMYRLWRRYNAMNAAAFDQDYDWVVVHDPQPVGILAQLMERGSRQRGGLWVWHCHLDLRDAQSDVWQALRPHAELYEAVIFSLRDYARADLGARRVAVMPPAIDPLSPKNMPLPTEATDEVLRRYGVDPRRPMLCQVSPFDSWNDPLAAIDTYLLVKGEVPEVQMVVVGSMVGDDPQGWACYEQAAWRASDDPDLHLLSTLHHVGNVETNAFQRAAHVVLQRSVRKGFAWGIAEAQWKERPVVAGRAGAIPYQVQDGETGYLADTIEESAARVLHLLRHPAVAERMGQAAQERIRHEFVITRCLRDYLRFFGELAS